MERLGSIQGFLWHDTVLWSCLNNNGYRSIFYIWRYCIIRHNIFEESYYGWISDNLNPNYVKMHLSRNRHVPITPGKSHPLIYNTRESGIKVMIPQNIFQLTHSLTQQESTAALVANSPYISAFYQRCCVVVPSRALKT